MSARRGGASSRSSRSPASRRPRSRASSTSRSAPVLRRLSSGAFLRGVVEKASAEFPERFPPFHSTAYSYIAQLWSGNKQLHYEAWIRERLAVIEVGLHFEADALTNARLLAAFRARAHTIERVLGASVRIEGWDKGWARVWEPIELATLDTPFLDRVASRLAAYVSVLEPVLRAEVPADVAWAEPKEKR